MAWIDDRIWCHPKTADLSSAAFAAWVKGIAYSSGMGTSGRLTAGQQKLIGGQGRARAELIAIGLWHENGTDGAVDINDWDEHNGKRDARRAADRERKRQARSAGTSAGQSADSPQDAPQDGSALNARRRAPDDGSDGSDLGSSSVGDIPKAVNELDQAVTLDPTTAPAGNGTASDSEEELTPIGAIIEASLQGAHP